MDFARASAISRGALRLQIARVLAASAPEVRHSTRTADALQRGTSEYTEYDLARQLHAQQRFHSSAGEAGLSRSLSVTEVSSESRRRVLHACARRRGERPQRGAAAPSTPGGHAARNAPAERFKNSFTKDKFMKSFNVSDDCNALAQYAHNHSRKLQTSQTCQSCQK